MRCNKKEKRKEMYERYWKLPANERMHYDSSVDRVKKDTKFLGFSQVILKVLIPMWIIGLLAYISFGNPVLIFIDFLINFTMLGVIISFIFDLFSGFLFLNARKKGIRELNKRFKLIK